MAKNKRWTYPEIQYLKDYWGKHSLQEMSKKLDRTILAIKLKATRIKLTDRRRLQEDITYREFTKLLGRSYSDSWLKGRLKKANFPFSYFKVVNKKICMVNLRAFIRWFKNNLHILDIDNTNDGDFDAIEPNWLKEKRKADKMASLYKMRLWTKEEDDRLITLLNEYKYSYREISIKLKRTEGALKRRMLDLKLKQRPIIADKHIKWTHQEVDMVKDLYLKGYKSCVIAEFVPKSALAINGILERNNYFNPAYYGGTKAFNTKS